MHSRSPACRSAVEHCRRRCFECEFDYTTMSFVTDNTWLGLLDCTFLTTIITFVVTITTPCFFGNYSDAELGSHSLRHRKMPWHPRSSEISAGLRELALRTFTGSVVTLVSISM